MANICIEVCIISARGLGHRSSLLRPQWFAVGWIDSNNKYCTKIDTSKSPNPTWNTKFSVSIDERDTSLQNLSLTVEVYRREPIFLGEHLQGAATVQLKEFLARSARDVEPSGVEETGSFQLRKRNSGKSQGLVDISIRISKEREGFGSHSGPQEGFTYSSDQKDGITLALEDGPIYTYPTRPQPPPLGQFGGYNQTGHPYGKPTPAPVNHQNPSTSSTGYPRRTTPPPPPPPSNAGFLPTLFPAPPNRLPEHYINVPPNRTVGQAGGPGFGMGLGAGALAAGAVIFGDDFLSGSSFPASLSGGGGGGGSLIVSTDPPF
ncbi:protein SRC2 homolog [Typha angustifolia]|uniref:protein SRC2 homolog n=1 Tax=Typha angustifolia TaxID=59011 RepID=UPI003C2CBCB8